MHSTFSASQLDFLEHPAITDVVVCSVVLEEVRHKNTAAYQRLRALCASDAKRFFVFANEHHRWVLQSCVSLLFFVWYVSAVYSCFSAPSNKYYPAETLTWCPEMCACRETFIKSEPGESSNDRNDRAIRVATKWCVFFVCVCFVCACVFVHVCVCVFYPNVNAQPD